MEEKRRQSRPPEDNFCQVKKCQNRVSERKPFCIDHLHFLEYPNKIQTFLLQREREINRALQDWVKLSSKDIVAQEILDEIEKRGEITNKRLAKNLELHRKVIENYIKKLELEEILQTKKIEERKRTKKRFTVVTFRQPAAPKKMQRAIEPLRA